MVASQSDSTHRQVVALAVCATCVVKGRQPMPCLSVSHSAQTQLRKKSGSWRVQSVPSVQRRAEASRHWLVDYEHVSYQPTAVTLHLWKLRGTSFALNTVYKDLKTLVIENCPDITDGWLSAVALQCPKLTAFHCGPSGITDDGVKTLALHCCDLLTVSLVGPSFTDVGLSAITTKCCGLTSLSLAGAMVTDAGIRDMAARCPRLSNLNVSFNWRITDDALNAVTSCCTLLTALNISRTRISDHALVPFATKFTGLWWLDISEAPLITDRSLCVITESCNLRVLRLGESTCTSSYNRARIAAKEMKLLSCDVGAFGGIGKEQPACTIGKSPEQ